MTETCECGCVSLALTLLSFLFCTSLPTSRSASAKRAVRIDWLAPREGVAKGFFFKKARYPWHVLSDAASKTLCFCVSFLCFYQTHTHTHTLFIQPVVPNIPINHCAVVMLSLINSLSFIRVWTHLLQILSSVCIKKRKRDITNMCLNAKRHECPRLK